MYLIVCIYLYIYIRFCWENNLSCWSLDDARTKQQPCWLGKSSVGSVTCHLGLGFPLGRGSAMTQVMSAMADRCSVSSAGSTLTIGPVEN